MVACDSGPRAAPNTPCITRKATIWSSDWAAPQAIEARVKPIRLPMNSRLRPNRCASQPTGAVMMAEAIT